MAGKPTTMMPLQKLEKSCRPATWLTTMIARPLGRIVVESLAGSASGAALPGGEMSSSGWIETEGVLAALLDASPKAVNPTAGSFDIFQ